MAAYYRFSMMVRRYQAVCLTRQGCQAVAAAKNGREREHASCAMGDFDLPPPNPTLTFRASEETTQLLT